MKYVELFTHHHIALLHDWLTELGELFIDFHYPHRAGASSNYFIKCLEDVRDAVSQQNHTEIEITIFRAIVFPIRGTDYSALLQRALKELPDNQYYQIVPLNSYPQECLSLADGKGHEELRRDLANLELGSEIAIGLHPFDVPFQEFEKFSGASVEKLWFKV
ncbi:MAG: hypothetical protein JNL09_05160, partial [Anaerolineales bacterium]|nr:hypothetical protein [Anaerolineales bacterium]